MKVCNVCCLKLDFKTLGGIYDKTVFIYVMFGGTDSEICRAICYSITMLLAFGIHFWVMVIIAMSPILIGTTTQHQYHRCY